MEMIEWQQAKRAVDRTKAVNVRLTDEQQCLVRCAIRQYIEYLKGVPAHQPKIDELFTVLTLFYQNEIQISHPSVALPEIL